MKTLGVPTMKPSGNVPLGKDSRFLHQRRRELTEKVLHEARVFITRDLSLAATEQDTSVFLLLQRCQA